MQAHWLVSEPSSGGVREGGKVFHSYLSGNKSFIDKFV